MSTPPSTITVEALDGVTSVLHDFGGEGPAILFAHATGLHGLVWRPAAEFLTQRAHCFATDLRGHGDAGSQIDIDAVWDGFGLDGLAAASAISARDVVGVGHSLGGAALVLAELKSPGTFRHLCLYEPAIHAPGSSTLLRDSKIAIGGAMARIASRRRASFPSVGAALAHYVDKPPMATFQAAVLGAYVRHGFRAGPAGMVELKCTPETEAGIYLAAAHDHEELNQLAEITCPVTLMCGSESTDFQRCSVYALAEYLGQEPVVLSGADHFGPLQNPRQFAEAVARHVLDD